MTWVRLDDSMIEHPKVAALSDAALRTHLGGLCYCGRVMSDGFIPQRIGAGIAPPEILAELERPQVPNRAPLWEKTTGGWLIHDYLDYNPSREQIEGERASRRERGKKGADARWHGTSNASSMEAVSAMSDAPVPSPLIPTVLEDSKKPPLPRMLAKILADGIEQQLTAKQVLQVTAAWEANSTELRQSLAAVESASNPPAYLVKVARRISPLEIGAA
jgi:hypothetical protein